jgi:NAD(P)-dependent dehydrogenase (short-subunit alcohol dehydrogenase family)
VGRQVVQWLAQHGATVITGSRAPGGAAEGLAADLSRRKVPGEAPAKPGAWTGDASSVWQEMKQVIAPGLADIRSVTLPPETYTPLHARSITT